MCSSVRSCLSGYCSTLPLRIEGGPAAERRRFFEPTRHENEPVSGHFSLDVSGGSDYRSQSLNSASAPSHPTTRLGDVGRFLRTYRRSFEQSGPAVRMHKREPTLFRSSRSEDPAQVGSRRLFAPGLSARRTARTVAFRSLHRPPPRRLSRRHPGTARRTRRLCEQRVDNRPMIRDALSHLANDSAWLRLIVRINCICSL